MFPPKDSDRTLTSAQVTTCGLFPPNGSQVWNENIHWQPVPIHTIPTTLDYVLAVRKPCDHLNYIMNKYVNSTEYSAIFDKYQTLLEALRTYTGSELQTLHDIFFLESKLFIEISKGFQ